MGWKSCVIKCCTTKPNSFTETFHRLPADEQDRQQWINFISKLNGDDYICPKDPYICSRHFKECCKTSGSKILVKHVPTLLNEPCKAYDTEEITIVASLTTAEKLQLTRNELETLKQKYTALEIAHKQLQEEIRVLRQFRKRQEEAKAAKRNHPLEVSSVAKRAKHEENQEMSPGLKEIANLICAGSHSKGKRYSELIREFSYQLHYLSPRAYSYVRETFGKSLPDPTNFYLWTKHMITCPGFLEESLNFIQQRNETSGYNIYYALSFDEISIRQQVIFHGNKLMGFVNYGNIAKEITTEPDLQAKSALFIVATEINGTKRFPIGYILTAGLDSILMSTVIKASLSKMAEVGGKVLTITFDGLPTNFAAVEKLGAKLDINMGDIQPFIIHPTNKSKVYIMPDPVHMFKLLRNTFKKCGRLMDIHGNMIEWSYLQSLLQLQSDSGLRAANKLTKRHISFENQKMKVKLCSQTFSNSVSVALKVCEKLGLPAFDGSEKTAEFVSLMDRLFDSLNSKPHGTGYKTPLKASNKCFWLPLFDKCLKYLLELHCENENKPGEFELLYKTKKATCIKGLVIAINSLKLLMEKVVKNTYPDLQYLPTYKLCQDMVELLFSVIRSRFGFNDNPNALQLESALKGMLCVNLQVGLNGNCVSEDNSRTKVSALGNLRALQDPDRTEELELEEELDLPDVGSLTLFVRNIGVYISGFVGRAVCSKISCSSCLLALVPCSVEEFKLQSDATLINEKDNGGLFIPSSDLVEICKIAEVEVRRGVATGLSSVNREEIVKNVLQYCEQSSIFKELRTEDSEEHPLNSNHVTNIIKLAAEHYLKTRLHYLAKDVSLNTNPITVRNKCTKIVHFNGN